MTELRDFEPIEGPPSRYTEGALDRAEDGRREAMQSAQLSPERIVFIKSHRPEQIRIATRWLLRDKERVTTQAPALTDQYGLIADYWTLSKRAEALSTGLSDPTRQALMSFAKFEEDGILISQLVPPPLKEVEIPEGSTADERKKLESVNESIRQRNKELALRRIDAEERRPDLVNELGRCAEEVLARSKLDTLWGRYLGAGGSVDEYANDYLIPIPYQLTAENLRTIFSLPPTLFTKPGQELTGALATSEYARDFGKDIDIAMRAMVIITLCEKPEALKELMSRPGWRLLGLSPEKVRQFIGDVSSWKLGKRSEDTIENEIRGKLTKHGNIYARGENVEAKREVNEALVELVGGNSAAVEIASRMFRLFVIAAEGGGERFVDDKGESKIQLEGFPESDDLTKLALTAMWQEKQANAGHNFGPLTSKGAYENLVVNFLKFAGYETNYPVKEGESRFRSLWELWWGYEADSGGRLREEGYRLGEMAWDKLSSDVFRDFMLRIYIAGRKDVGLFVKLTASKLPVEQLYSMDFWRDFKRDLNVVVNNSLVTNGKFRSTREDDIKKEVESEKIRFLKSFEKGVKSLRQVRPERNLVQAAQVEAEYDKAFGHAAYWS